MKNISIFLFTLTFLFCLCSCEVQQDLNSSQSRGIESTLAHSNEVFTQNKELSLDGIAPDIRKIIEKGTLNIALVSQDLKTFYEDIGDGNLDGIDIAIAKDLAKGLGVEVIFDRSANSHDELTEYLKNNKVDMVMSIYSITPERSMYVLQSDPYFKSNMGISVSKQFLVRNDINGSPINFMRNNTFNISILKNSSHIDYAKNMFPYCNIIEVDSNASGYQKVVKGEADAFLSNEIKFTIDYNQDKTLPLYMDVFTFSDIQDKFCVSISRDSPQLLNYINAYIANQKPITVKDVERRLNEKELLEGTKQ